MANKNCLVYETLGKINDLSVLESANDNEVRLSGVFGVCGVKNNNRRIYSKQNYGMMVEALQETIKNEGCPGELEHPNTMNITLENVSHKIESIQMNEDGTVTGTILLLDTPKGKIAKAIVKGGLPLYISSRGAGSIDENGNVTLTTLKTYDLVGTPGFSQARLNLKENQCVESLNESLEDGPISWAIVEGDEFGNDPDAPKEKKEEDPDNSPADAPKDDETPKDGDAPKDEPKNDDDNKNSNEDITMNELKEAIDKLTEKVSSLEAELHVAKESLSAAEDKLANIKETNYAAIEKWMLEEFAPEFKSQVITEMAGYVEGWITEEFAPEIQNYLVEQFAPEIQNYLIEQFAPEVQKWVVEHYSPEIQNYMVEQFAPEIQGWICEQFAPTLESWIVEHFATENNANVLESVESKLSEGLAGLEKKINENVNSFFEAQKDVKFAGIDKVLESLENAANADDAVKALTEAQKADKTFEGYYAIENMPANLRPAWEMLAESRKFEIARSSRMYDFTKAGMLESFWAGVNMDVNPIRESKTLNIAENKQAAVAAMMRSMRH